MANPTTAELPAGGLVDHARIDAELEQHFRDLLLEHARLGQPICESRDGAVVWVTPEEVFARYGLDANGKPARP